MHALSNSHGRVSVPNTPSNAQALKALWCKPCYADAPDESDIAAYHGEHGIDVKGQTQFAEEMLEGLPADERAAVLEARSVINAAAQSESQSGPSSSGSGGREITASPVFDPAIIAHGSSN